MEFFALALVAKIPWTEIILWIYEHPACNDVGDSLAGLCGREHTERTRERNIVPPCSTPLQSYLLEITPYRLKNKTRKDVNFKLHA